jgi:hypothetical protein
MSVNERGFVFVGTKMKKQSFTLASLIFFCLISVGCSNPYDTIQEQKKIDELVMKIDKCNLESQEKCARGAKQFFHDAGYEQKNTLAGYVCHYNKKLNKCFIEIGTTILNANGSVSMAKNLFDAFEGKEYASFFRYVPKEKNYSAVKPQQCQMLDNHCTTEEEYDRFVKSYMEE